MRARTFARRQMIDAAAGWSHPYQVGPFSPLLYADGGDTGDASKGEAGEDGKPDTGDASSERSDAEDGDSTDWKAEAEKYKALMRKHEARAKENASAAKERDDLKRKAMSDQERAVDEATAKARAEERVRLAGKLARQGFIAAAAGRLPNAASVADDLNLAKYVGEDGEIDESGLTELVDRLAPPKPDKKAEAESEAKPKNGRGFDQGPRGTGAREKATTVASGRDLYASRKKTTSI